MLEVIAVFFLIVISWINWSRYYVQKQIRKALSEVTLDNPVRSVVQFPHFLRYFKLKDHEEGEVIIFEYDKKEIHIAQDGKETILYIKEALEVEEEVKEEIQEH